MNHLHPEKSGLSLNMTQTKHLLWNISGLIGKRSQMAWTHPIGGHSTTEEKTVKKSTSPHISQKLSCQIKTIIILFNYIFFVSSGQLCHHLGNKLCHRFIVWHCYCDVDPCRELSGANMAEKTLSWEKTLKEWQHTTAIMTQHLNLHVVSIIDQEEENTAGG